MALEHSFSFHLLCKKLDLKSLTQEREYSFSTINVTRFDANPNAR